MKYLLSILASAFILIAFTGCYYDNEETLYPQLSSQCDTTNVSYSATISTIMSSYCTTCHGSGASGGIDLQTYELVKANASKVYGSINHDDGYVAMPKGGSKLDDCTILQMKVWIDNNMPQ